MEYYSDESENDLDRLVENAAEEDDEMVGVSEAEEEIAPSADTVPEVKAPKPKRVVKNPQPKLNFDAIQGPKGLLALNDLCQKYKFMGSGNEKEDLSNILKLVEQWSFRLFPKFHFEDSLKRLEALGKKREVQVYLRKIRNDMMDNADVNNEDKEDEPVPVPMQQPMAEDLFDELLSQQIASTQGPSQPNLSDEQRERMERNRKLALERKLQRQSEAVS